MINEYYANKFCGEDISLIENYEKAIADKSQTWDCHHRLGVCILQKKLKELGCYWKRPASELIFITKSEHRRLHAKKAMSDSVKKKISDKMKGEKNPRAMKVSQIDIKTGQIIKIWPCMNDAAKKLGISLNCVSRCCKGKYKSAGGFVWRYVD